MVEVSLDQLIQRADLVVRGTVMRAGARLHASAGHVEPRTHVWIRVDELLAGAMPKAGVVHLWEPGGHCQDLETTVAGGPSYERGEEVVVFLARDAEHPDTYRTLEMTQGKYHVLPHERGAELLAVRDLSDVSLVKWRRRRMEVLPAPEQKPVRISDLELRVRALRRVAPGAMKGGAR